MGARATGVVGVVVVRACLVLCLNCLVWLGSLGAREGDALPVGMFFGDQPTEVFRLSPDGNTVAFLKKDGEASQLCIGRPESMDDSTVVLTKHSDGNVFGFLWLSNAEIAYTARKAGGGERIGCVSFSGSPAFRARPGVTTVSEGTDAASLAGACRGSNGSTGILLSMPSARHPSFPDLYWTATDGGKRELLYENIHQLGVSCISGDGKTVAGIRCHQSGENELLAIKGDTCRSLLRSNPSDSLNIVAISADGRSIYILSNAGPGVNFLRLERVDSESGSREVIAEDPEHSVDVGEVLFDRSDDCFLGARYFRQKSDYQWAAGALERHYANLKKLLPEGDVKIVAVDSDRTRLLVSCTTDIQPEADYFYDAGTGRLTRLSSMRADLPVEQLGRMRPITYRARDGQPIHGYLTLPAWLSQKKLPTVVFPHGGPNKRNYWGYDPRVQFLANRGYAVFQPNFRGSSGYGKRFQNAGDKAWGRGVMQEDVTDGVRWLIASGLAAPDKIAILGGSYGGFAALAGVAFTPELYAAGVSLFGPSNLVGFVSEIPADWRSFEGDINVKIGDPRLESERERMKQQSPLYFTDQIRAPLLIYQGAHDPIVKKTQAEAFVSRRRAAGGTVSYLFSEDGAHGFSNATTEQAVYLAIERFLAPILGGMRQQETGEEMERHLATLQEAGRKVE